jgi:tetratricopeptide (TPR) repeat protein
MSTTTNLKAHARALEQQEQWSAALEVYEQLVAEQAPGEDLEVGLWNRIGDLQMRLGQPGRAVEAYERAVQAYEEAGLHNNALALCGKVLRISPGRSTVYLTLGVISAMKGFAADARAHLQKFVGHANRGDQLDKALGTLMETARNRLADAEVLQAIAEQLREHGWGDRLEIELGPACDRLRADGMIEEAERARAVLNGEALPPSPARIADSLAPGLDSVRAEPSHAEDEIVEIESDGLPTAREDAPSSASAPQQGEIAADAELLEISPLDGLQTTHVGAGDDDVGLAEEEGDGSTIAGFESGPADSDMDELDDADLAALPLLTFQPELDVAALDALDLSIELTDESANEPAGF